MTDHPATSLLSDHDSVESTCSYINDFVTVINRDYIREFHELLD